MSSSAFPEGFLFGSSTSAHQVEGCWKCDNKGLSMWDYLTNYQKEFHLANANEACKSYPDFYKDVECAKKIGLNFYRFSISWPRILKGNGERTLANLNPAGIKYYDNLISELLENGIEPFVTIYHWDLPHEIQDNFGGWTNSLIIDYLEDYADLLFKIFGDKVKYWTTINEPLLVIAGYENGGPEGLKLAPGKSLRTPANYIVAHNILRAHARIYHLYENKYRQTQQGKIGISLVGTCYLPQDPSNPLDQEATDRANAFYLGLFANPIFTKEGDYPEIVRKIVDENSKIEGRTRSRLPQFTEEEKKSLIGTADFFAVNHYSTSLCYPSPPKTSYNIKKAPPKILHYATYSTEQCAWYEDDINVGFNTTDHPYPDGFRKMLKYIKDNYGNPPIIVTENGIGEKVEKNVIPGIHDQIRVDYLKDFLAALLKAIHEDECNVIGYTYWSLLDSFEWSNGYNIKMGIVKVDFEKQERPRELKDSARYLKQVIDKRCLETPITRKHKEIVRLSGYIQ